MISNPMIPPAMIPPPILAVVVPCYNEEDVFPETLKRLSALLTAMIASNDIHPNSFLCFVDDGSRDATWSLIDSACGASEFGGRIRGLKLAHNRGHQFALLAGLEYSADHADCSVSIDADLQDDIRIIPDMVAEFRAGIDTVYAVRRERKTDTFFKRNTALLFYKLMLLMGVRIVYNHADYRLVSRRVLHILREEYHEVNLFLRGIIPHIGFRSSTVYYDRAERFAGESKYPFVKMLEFAFDGITSFSIAPLRFVTTLGSILCGISMFLALYAVWSYFALSVVHGWTSIVLPLYFLGGIQLLCIGIIGEYIGKIYREVKARPRYIIETIVGQEPSV